MELDFSDFFKKYERLVAEVDKAFGQVQAQHGECINCGEGCSDCCHAMFDLSLIEALYLNRKFNTTFEGQRRSELLDRADKADRRGYKIKREAFHLSREGARTSEILEAIAKARVRCPLLGADDKCELYDARPITCRLYGIPTSIGGKAHTCGKAGFKEGVQYPTVQIEKLQDRLAILSDEFVRSLRTKYSRLAETYVPVSMALMNKYDSEYLGILGDEEWEKIEKVKATMAGATRSTAPASAPGGVAAQTFDGEGQARPAACTSCDEKQGSDACSTCGTLNWELGGKE
ncbi:MAG: YkgJ family cysteine cluster protein [Proteobacteria bacterium]|nr:YkgJ family cysteine cluster protein [Pseudomonadota bacterium]